MEKICNKGLFSNDDQTSENIINYKCLITFVKFSSELDELLTSNVGHNAS